MKKKAIKSVKSNLNTYSKYKYLLIELVKKNIKLKYRNSWLGVVWTFLQPLLNMIVLSLVFTSVFGRKQDGVLCYPIYLLTGRLVFEFFTQSTKKALRSFRENAAIIKKVYVPKYMYPLSAILSNFVTFLISIVMLLVVTILFKLTGWSGGDQIVFDYHVLGMFVPLLILLLFSVGVGMILSTFAVFFRDIEYIYDVFSVLLFYLLPVVYHLSRIDNVLVQWIVRINPLYSIIQMLRQCVLYGQNLSVQYIVYSLCASLVVLLFGVLVFNKNSEKFILHI